VVPHLDTTVASSSGSGADPAFVVGLLSIDDKRESNRDNNKRLYYNCHCGGTSPAFVVSLLDVDNKRGGNWGIVAVAGCWQWQQRRPGVCCQPVWHRGQGQEGQSVGNRGQQALTTCAHSGKVCD